MQLLSTTRNTVVIAIAFIRDAFNVYLRARTSGELIARLVAGHRETGCPIIASSYAGSYGAPALFGKQYFAELTKLEGAAGAKQLIQKRIAWVHLVDFPQGEIDIDTPYDLARLS
jgi:molybdenum cofactor cytidylyltransferase